MLSFDILYETILFLHKQYYAMFSGHSMHYNILICSCFFIYIFKYLFLNTLLPMWANRRSVFQGAKVCIKIELFKKKGFGGVKFNKIFAFFPKNAGCEHKKRGRTGACLCRFALVRPLYEVGLRHRLWRVRLPQIMDVRLTSQPSFRQRYRDPWAGR